MQKFRVVFYSNELSIIKSEFVGVINEEWKIDLKEESM